MAAAQVANAPQDRPAKRKPFASFVRKLGFKTGDPQEKTANNKKSNSIALKPKKHSTWGKNNPYPESGYRPQQQASHPSFGDSERAQYSNSSLPLSGPHERDGHTQSNKSGAPTLATNPETVHSDAGNSRAATTTTGAGALSSIDGAGAGSTFSSPNQSDRSLTTTLTTIQSTGQGAANAASGGNTSNVHHTQPMGSQFVHQYPVSPSHSTMTASAIPRHMHTDSNALNSYNHATTNNVLTDNASILTLASSSKRRRRSMDTDASVRALAPSSVHGGSRESLPLSVLSTNIEPARHSMQGMGGASAERASVYSSSGFGREGVGSTAIASERNSYYKQAGDAKSLRSITNLKNDAASITGIYPRSEYDARSINNAGDVASLRSVEGAKTVDSHTRNGSITNSISSPIPSLLRQASTGGNTALSLSRRNSDLREEDDAENDKLDGNQRGE